MQFKKQKKRLMMHECSRLRWKRKRCKWESPRGGYSWRIENNEGFASRWHVVSVNAALSATDVSTLRDYLLPSGIWCENLWPCLFTDGNAGGLMTRLSSEEKFKIWQPVVTWVMVIVLMFLKWTVRGRKKKRRLKRNSQGEEINGILTAFPPPRQHFSITQ